MLLRHPDMRTFDGALHASPEAFDAVGVCGAAHIFFLAVIDGPVVVAVAIQGHEATALVCSDARAFGYPGAQMGQNGSAAAVGQHAGNDLAATLHHAQHDGLVILALLVLAADESLVRFDNRLAGTAQRRVTIGIGHVLADFVAYAPSGLVGHAQLALQFLRRNAVPRRGEDEHCVEPLLQRRAGFLEGRPHHRVNVVAAIARIGGQLRELAERAKLAAFRTCRVIAEAGLEQMLKARLIGRKIREKLLNIHMFLCHTHEYGKSKYIRQGDICQ